MTKRRKVIVDGSNLATEGRDTPSLKQLEEAVKEFLVEYPDREVVVVVDATFEHRVGRAERARVKQAELDGDIVTPPAGAVGRGDAFILRIARRANAAVLSNDSFQEFHAEHPWLFEEGRLIGGKPVVGVGWIFTPRNPVRGARSRRARAALPAAAPATEPPEATPKAPRRAKPDKAPEPRADGAERGAAAVGAKTARAAKRSQQAAREPAAREPAAREPAREGPARPPAPQVAERPRGVPAPAATARGAAQKPEPVNTLPAFRRLVSDHPLGDTVEGEVVQFTSHGAMVAVPVGRTMRVVCYAPLRRLGDPPPARARDVLAKGSTRTFRVVSFDEARRRPELELVQS